MFSPSADVFCHYCSVLDSPRRERHVSDFLQNFTLVLKSENRCSEILINDSSYSPSVNGFPCLIISCVATELAVEFTDFFHLLKGFLLGSAFRIISKMAFFLSSHPDIFQLRLCVNYRNVLQHLTFYRLPISHHILRIPVNHSQQQCKQMNLPT